MGLKTPTANEGFGAILRQSKLNVRAFKTFTSFIGMISLWSIGSLGYIYGINEIVESKSSSGDRVYS